MMTVQGVSAALLTSRGEEIVLADKLGTGGEGAVYRLQNQPLQVAKIYHQTPGPDKQAKLRAMVQGGDANLQQIAAWPIDVIEQQGNIIGFVMPLLANSQPVHHLYNPGQRKQLFPEADYAFLVHTARNIAAAFAVIHSHGHTVGDVNQGNLLVRRDGTVRLIDCDSFQIHIEGRYFVCEVGVAHFTAPEIQGKLLSEVITTINHDNFGLAVLIFHLLMMGRHPFAGIYSGDGEMPLEQAIKEFRYVYGESATAKKMRPPPNSISPDILSPELATMFERAFSGVSRPVAEEWVDVLEGFSSRLKACHQVELHKYPANMFGCPWCYYASHKNVLFFNQKTVTSKPQSEARLPNSERLRPSRLFRKILNINGETSGFDRPFDLLVYGLIGSWVWIGVFDKSDNVPVATARMPQPVVVDPLPQATKRQPVIPKAPVIGQVKEEWHSYLDNSRWRKIDHWGKELSGKQPDVAVEHSWAAVTDVETGMTWSIEMLDGRHEYLAVNRRVGHRNWAGYDDWRLPTVAELNTLRELDSDQEFAKYFPRFAKMTKPAYFWVSDGRSAEAVNKSAYREPFIRTLDRQYQDPGGRADEIINGGRAYNFMDGSYQLGGSHYVLFVRGRHF